MNLVAMYNRGSAKALVALPGRGWWVMLGVPALLLAALLLSMTAAPVLRAAVSDTYVNCSGQANKPTIQAAVNDTAPGGTVHICTGTYSESVNLATMNNNLGEGDITLLAEDGPGAVNISPAVGSGIRISISTFSGNIAIVGVNVTSGDAFGIDLNYGGAVVSGTVLISDVMANGAAFGGIRVAATGDVTVHNVTAEGNEWDGIVVQTFPPPIPGDPLPNVTLQNVTANNNGKPGVSFASGIAIGDFSFLQACPATLPVIRLTNTVANDNTAFGADIFSNAREVIIDGSQFHRNGADGTSVGYGGNLCNNGVVVTNSAADDNGAGGIRPREVGASAFVPGAAGFRLTAPGSVTVSDASADRNQGPGFCLFSVSPDIAVGDSSAENNGQDGFELRGECLFFGDVGAAAEVPQAAPVVVAQNGSVAQGIEITNTTAFSNGDNGIELAVTGATDLAVPIGQVVAQQVAFSVPVALTNVSAVRNAANGVLVGIGSSLFFDGAAGLETAAAVPAVTPIVYPPTTIDSSLVISNRQSGVRFESQVLKYDGSQPPIQIQVTQPFTPASFVNGNIICANLVAGLSISDTVLSSQFPVPNLQVVPLNVDAQGNWWGDPLGPKHPDNPNGTAGGNPVLDRFNTGSGEVLFSPWISQISALATVSPTLPGVPTSLTFQFSDAAKALFLGQGVGNLNDPPIFSIATNNGVLAGTAASAAVVQEFITANQGAITVALTPASAGVATVTLTGPCGLVQQIVVPVATPAIQIEKSPDLQVVTGGSAAQFSVTVTNSGDITLTQVAVTDALAPNCARTLPDIGPKLTQTYTCTLVVTDDLVNTAGVSGQALLGAAPAGPPLTDSDTAAVRVPKITLQKTVGDAPGVCAPTNTLTVDVGDTVYYCYRVTNTGNVPIDLHDLDDDKLGDLLEPDLTLALAPGASVDTVAAGLAITASLDITTTNVATWTGRTGSAVATASATATVNVPPPPTDLDETDQPGRPGRIFLPAVGKP